MWVKCPAYSRFLTGFTNESLTITTIPQNIARTTMAGCTVLVLHHPGHTNTERSRGSSKGGAALRGEVLLTNSPLSIPCRGGTHCPRRGC